MGGRKSHSNIWADIGIAGLMLLLILLVGWGLYSLRGNISRLGRAGMGPTAVPPAMPAAIPSIPPQLQKPGNMPDALWKAIKAEWPDSIVSWTQQVDNLPGREPEKVWYCPLFTPLQRAWERNLKLYGTNEGIILRVESVLDHRLDIEATLPYRVQQAMTAALPGGAWEAGRRTEMRADETGTKLPQSTVNFLLQVKGPESIVGLSISGNGEAKKLWETPPAVFKSMQDMGLLDQTIYPISVTPSVKSGQLVWEIASLPNTRYIVAEDGEVLSANIELEAKDVPQAAKDAITSNLKDRQNADFRRLERVFDDMKPEALVRLPKKFSAYRGASAGSWVEVTEKGELANVVTREGLSQFSWDVYTGPPPSNTGNEAAGQNPRQLEIGTAASLFPGWDMIGFRTIQTYLDDNLAQLPEPIVDYRVAFRKNSESQFLRANVFLNSDGTITQLDDELPLSEIPAPVSAAALADLPDGRMTYAVVVEYRVDDKGAPLPKPKVRYIVKAANEDTTAHVVTDENGNIFSKCNVPVWDIRQ